MTPDQEAKFEAWAKSGGLNLYRYDGQFTDRATQYALSGWKACLAAHAIDQPSDKRESVQEFADRLVEEFAANPPRMSELRDWFRDRIAQRESCGKSNTSEVEALRETAQKLRHMLVRLDALLAFAIDVDDEGITFHDPYKVNAAFADAARLLDDTAALTDKQETQ